MSPRDWFRGTTWSSTDRAAFLARLARSRHANRAQYLRIQAHHLEVDASPPLYVEALELLDRLVREVPAPFELALAHVQRGRCLRALGHLQESLAAFRAAMTAQRAFPNVHTDVHLEFAETILASPAAGADDDLRREAVAALHEFAFLPPDFPVNQFRAATAHALLLDMLGRQAEAQPLAAAALTAALMTESPFRYHRKLGLVHQLATDIETRLKRLARGTA